ncbi:hypothetical protein GGF31_005206 [Allomyces arbusculus]|nr:hypothetical protein GGF31_005206 [Allomyces arbusculus]
MSGEPLTGVVLRGARDEYGAEKYVPRLIVRLDGFLAARPINKDLIGPNYAHIMGGGEDDYEIHHTRPPNCYYHGSVVDYDASLAAISLCNGMNGVIQFNETHRYTIRPDTATSSHLTRDSDLPNGLSRPHVLIRDVGIPAPASGQDEDNFCRHARSAATNSSDIDTQIQEAAARMRRDAPMLKSVELGTPTLGLVKRGINNNKVIELMIASDYERYQAWGNQTESSVFNLINYMSLLTSNGLLPSPYTLRVTLVGQFTATSPMWVPVNFTTSATLSLFCQWRSDRLADPAFAGTFLARNDHGQVLTARTGNGIAWVGTMCSSTYSCSLAPGGHSGVIAGMVTAMTHEVGHNLGSNHDNQGSSTCTTTSFIMNPSYCGNCQQQPSAWSNCSVADIRQNLATNAGCLDTLASPLCGNGIVEVGEQCDSGDTLVGSPCCTTTCQFRPGATCDKSNGPCCTTDCQPASGGTFCRASASPCDVADVCLGTNATCPDTTQPDGIACTSGGVSGTCRTGMCMLSTGTTTLAGAPTPTTGTRPPGPAGTLMPQSNGNGTDGSGNGSSATRAMLWRTARTGGWWDNVVAVTAALGPVGVVLVALLVPFV